MVGGVLLAFDVWPVTRVKLSRLDLCVVVYGLGLPLLSLIALSRHGHLAADSVRTACSPLQFVVLYGVASRLVPPSAAAVVIAGTLTGGLVNATVALLQVAIPGRVAAAVTTLGGGGDSLEQIWRVEGTRRATGLFDHPQSLGAYLACIAILATACGAVSTVGSKTLWVVTAAAAGEAVRPLPP